MLPISVGSGADMALENQIVLRVSVKLVEQLDAYAERLRAETGLRVTRSDAARKLLEQALAAEVGDGAKSSSRKPKR